MSSQPLGATRSSDSIKQKNSKDQENDKNFLYDEEANTSIQTPEDSKILDKIYRKLDIRIIPALWCLYFLTSFGSSAYGNSLTMNAEAGHSTKLALNLSAQDTSTASALYYVAYIIFDVPMNLAMTKLPPQAWLARIVISLGLVYACFAAIENSGGLIACRFLTGICNAGTWPGLTYYVSLWYPAKRTTRRIGFYFTAAQISASAAGLVAAGFQKMDMMRGLYGWQWMFLVYGCLTVFVGITLIWWLPDRPVELKKNEKKSIFKHFLPKNKKPLTLEQRVLHLKDMQERYSKPLEWGLKDIVTIICDVEIWPLIIMYFGVVGTGFGLAVFGTTIIKATNPSLSSINVSLLYAPIWLFDLSAILLITPLSDKFKNYRPFIFSCSTSVIMCGLFVMTYSPDKWSKYGGLLICGFGLGPTVPTCMSMAADIFGRKYGDVGTAVSAALVSGLGNLGSVVGTYALYSGWPEDIPRLFQYSNMILVLICGCSIIAAAVSAGLTRYLENKKKSSS
ncbi:vitamin H transporter 1 [Ascoidea rubescens DSM 1968]|uniref:Vitamin H transporter 1 n=1 Tax=Ascoidea rubescens DSM 1968 TaxID=1344418 RepID=A0A1D2VP94_9ASCO|nr:vitamin H transporter 1 [Ascoidea rubescens DSM 1968]ODV63428.1 vitamin H transporter 1 [Ascoidea rubescens DSM 1968]